MPVTDKVFLLKTAAGLLLCLQLLASLRLAPEPTSALFPVLASAPEKFLILSRADVSISSFAPDRVRGLSTDKSYQSPTRVTRTRTTDVFIAILLVGLISDKRILCLLLLLIGAKDVTATYTEFAMNYASTTDAFASDVTIWTLSGTLYYVLLINRVVNGVYRIEIYTINTSGTVMFQNIYGCETADNYARSIVNASNGGVLVTGVLRGSCTGYNRPFLTRFSAAGAIEWTQVYYGVVGEGQKTIELSTGGYALSTNNSASIIVTNSDGTAKCHQNLDWAYELNELVEISGVIYVVGTNTSKKKCVVVKVTAATCVTKIYLMATSSSYSYVCYGIKAVSDGNLVIIGRRTPVASTESSMYLAKVNVKGELQWEQTYAAGTINEGRSLIELKNYQLMLAGYTTSAPAGPGGEDAWTVRTDSYGKIEAQSFFGGTDNDRASSIKMSSDGTYCVIAGMYTPPGAPSNAYLIVSGVCPDGQYLLPSPGIGCGNCPTNCDRCKNSTYCQVCASGYSLFYASSTAVSCEAQCPVGYYSSSGVCVVCMSNCADCSDSTTCVICSSGYLLSADSKSCVTTCPNGSYHYCTDSLNTNCLCGWCLTGCKTCDNGLNCTACPDKYYLASLDSLFYACPDGCSVCDDSLACTSCEDGYTLNGNTCEACTDTGCKTCSPKTACTVCKSGQYLDLTSVCVSSCPDGTYVQSSSYCTVCNVLNCAKCSSAGQCDACNCGYTVQASTSNVYSCAASCSTTPRYFTDSSLASGSCVSTICHSCLTGCSACTDGSTCTTCTMGYYLSNTICVSTCPAGTYKGSSVCSSCLTNCVACSSGTTCTTCATGFFRSTSGGTVECTACTSNCDTCVSATTCTKCASTYYYYYNTTSTTGSCGLTCPDYMYPNATTMTCTSCISNCKTCEDMNYCLACNSGLMLYHITPDGDKCSSVCPAGTYISVETSGSVCRPCLENCNSCTNNTKCLNCASSTRYFYSTDDGLLDHCVDKCPGGYYPTTDFTCEPCLDHCELCGTKGHCAQCASGYFLYVVSVDEDKCLSPCNAGYYGDNDTQTCAVCDSYCATCHGAGSTQCDTCNSALAYPMEGTAVSCVTDCDAVSCYLEAGVCKSMRKI